MSHAPMLPSEAVPDSTRQIHASQGQGAQDKSPVSGRSAYGRERTEGTPEGVACATTQWEGCSRYPPANPGPRGAQVVAMGGPDRCCLLFPWPLGWHGRRWMCPRVSSE